MIVAVLVYRGLSSRVVGRVNNVLVRGGVRTLRQFLSHGAGVAWAGCDISWSATGYLDKACTEP
jgi:hypothetical protein